MNDDEPVVKIGLPEIYKEVLATKEVATRTEDKVIEATGDIKDHETRIRKLEQGWWKAVGAAFASSALVGWGISYFTNR